MDGEGRGRGGVSDGMLSEWEVGSKTRGGGGRNSAVSPNACVADSPLARSLRRTAATVQRSRDCRGERDIHYPRRRILGVGEGKYGMWDVRSGRMGEDCCYLCMCSQGRVIRG